jgi:high-affinity nickel-transport protein
MQMTVRGRLRRADLAGNLSSRLPPRWRFIPFPAIRIIATLSLVNVLVWIAVAIILRSHPKLSSSALLSYTFGLRHALDADHISAIDLMTRRLVATGSKPVTVGMWFSLGHSTIVLITCIVVAATSGALQERFEGFRNVGGIVGTAVSAGVLIVLGIGNGWILLKLVQKMRQVLKEEVVEDRAGGTGDRGLSFEGGGIMTRLFKKLFRLVDRPWKMYPLGVLFGLGFDTSSEVAVLGIASIQAIEGTSIWLILIFPVLFTGMSLFLCAAIFLWLLHCTFYVYLGLELIEKTNCFHMPAILRPFYVFALITLLHHATRTATFKVA